MNKKIFIITTIILLIDQISKNIISTFLSINETIEIIPRFFYLTYIQNTGAAWSILSNYTFLIIVISLIVLVLIIRYIKCFKNSIRNSLAFGFMLGGLLGNLLDRVVFSYVKDFLDFKIIGYDFPVFNIADVSIFIGVCLLIVAVFKGEDHEISS